VIIDKLFDTDKLDAVLKIIHQYTYWETQRSYHSLYIDGTEWQNTPQQLRR